MTVRYATIGLIALALSTGDAPARTWTDSTGKYRVEAEFLEFKAEMVHLKKADGATIAVPIGRLSDDDQEWVKRQLTFTIVNLKPTGERLTESLKTEVAKSRRLSQRTFVEFYADWCGPCRALRSSLDDPRMKDAFRGTYIIQMDADAWKNRLAGTGFSVNAIPVFYELDDEGRPTGRTIDGGAWGANIPANMAPPLKEFFDAKP